MTDVSIHIDDEHTEAQVLEELRLCLGCYANPVCLGHIALLAIAKSPLVYGGVFTDADDKAMRRIFGKNAKTSQIRAQIDAGERAGEIIRPDPQTRSTGESSRYSVFSPEWLVDIISTACHAIPTLTVDDVLWHKPYALVMHLVAEEHRRNGGITKRPDSDEQIKRAMEALNG